MSDEPDDTDLAIALDIIDIRLRALDIAAAEDRDLTPQAVTELATYYFNYALTGLVVPYPAPDKPKRLKAV